MMNGVLLIDKPSGPTSHDVVARIRRSSGERRIGHTGTLDPRATGLLPLVLGRATRLASLLTQSEKTYRATIRLGFATDTDDADGRPLSTPGVTPSENPSATPEVDRAALTDALSTFVGTFEQRPPAHSAKKIAGEKAYDLARQSKPVQLNPVNVTVTSLELHDYHEDRVELTLTASAGFYVRAMARDLGERLGCGAHLLSLRRTRTAGFDVTTAITLEDAESLGRQVEAHVLPPGAALPHLMSVQVGTAGLTRVRHGNPVGPAHLVGGSVPVPSPGQVRPVKLLDEDGQLIALAHSRGGLLHPVVVLG